jgi:tRNA A-37 threonylcarbamoyl transferase component Bud32
VNIPYHNKALPKGTILREWALEDILGVGGFGIVYRAKGVYFGEEVAIKEYFPGAISDRQDGTTVAPTDSSSEEVYALGLQKFLEEAKVLWGLSKPERHPNIVSVRSLFEIHGTAYMVMDFEHGVSLSQMLKDGRKFDEGSLMALLKPIAEGLDRAHRAGVLHRDIKPANILVDDTGRPVLIDFGSARFESGQATSTKVTFYTPPYAALEQYVKSYPQGPWTDIYALGVTLYQCITGEKPPEVLERMHGEQDQPLSARDWPGFSRVFTSAVDAAMGIRPLERPQSIAAWLDMFAAKPDAPPDDVTRIVTRATEVSRRTIAATVLPTSAAPAQAPIPAARAAAAPAPVRQPSVPRGKGLVWVGVAAAVLAAAGSAVFFLVPGHPAAPQAAVSAAIVATASASGAAHAPKIPAKPADNQLADAAGNLLAEAQQIDRPQREITALTAAKTTIEALTGQIRGLAPDKAAPLTEQRNSAVVGMAHSEANALARSGKSLLNDIALPAGKIAPTAVAAAVTALTEAKSKLDDAVAAALQAQDGMVALNAVKQGLATYAALTKAYGTAAPFYISARRRDVAALDTAAHAVSDKLAALGKVSQPWLLASQARKDAYQQLLSNAAQGATQIAQLDGLAHAAATVNDLKQISAVLTRVTVIKASLDDLLVKSNTASGIYNR